jgi:hypothetical protein
VNVDGPVDGNAYEGMVVYDTENDAIDDSVDGDWR